MNEANYVQVGKGVNIGDTVRVPAHTYMPRKQCECGYVSAYPVDFYVKSIVELADGFYFVGTPSNCTGEYLVPFTTVVEAANGRTE